MVHALAPARHRIRYAPRLGIVYHRGAVSSDLAWTEKERLRRCYEGGIAAYSALHGERRASLYRLVELVGVGVRWSVYGLMSRLRADDYYRDQARLYGWLVRFYARSNRGASPDQDSRLAAG